MKRRDHVTSLFASFAGQRNVLVIPRPFVDFCQGDILAALLFNQILYCSDAEGDKDGWFAKSYDEWKTEIGLTPYQIKRAINGDKRSKAGFMLTSVGVESDVRQSEDHKGAATLHYRVNFEKLHKSIVEFSPVLNNVKVPKQCSGQPLNNVKNAHIYKEIKDSSADKPAKSEKKPKPAQSHIAIIDAYWLGLPAKPIGATYSRYVRTAQQLNQAGITPIEITRYMEAQYRDEFWHGKTITLEYIKEHINGWLQANKPKPAPPEVEPLSDADLAAAVNRQLFGETS